MTQWFRTGVVVLCAACALWPAHAAQLVWDKAPLAITLGVNEERRITFPEGVRVGVPASLASALRTQSVDGTVYWLASSAFAPTRLQLQGIASGRTYLVDLSAAAVTTPPGPLTIALPSVSTDETPQGSTAADGKATTPQAAPSTPAPVLLTRFAAHQVYAPARLREAASARHDTVRQVPVSRAPLTLYRGASLVATPIGAWRRGTHFVTAVSLRNHSGQDIGLDPRALRGTWVTATFHHAHLSPAGTPRDVSVVYLVSNTPFAAAVSETP